MKVKYNLKNNKTKVRELKPGTWFILDGNLSYVSYERNLLIIADESGNPKIDEWVKRVVENRECDVVDVNIEVVSKTVKDDV